MSPSEEDWQQQVDEITALASILDQDFSLTAGPSVSGNNEEDVTALTAAEPCSAHLQCTAAVRVVLPSGKILIKVNATDTHSKPRNSQSRRLSIGFIALDEI